MLWLWIYLLIGLLIAGFTSKVVIDCYEKYEKGEINEKEIIDALEWFYKVISILGNNVFWILYFITMMLFWLPLVIFTIYNRVVKEKELN